MIISNQFVCELEEVWESIKWNRKFFSVPEYYDQMPFLAHAYSLEEIQELKTALEGLEEETEEGMYSAYLFQTSSGETLAITFSAFDEEE